MLRGLWGATRRAVITSMTRPAQLSSLAGGLCRPHLRAFVALQGCAAHQKLEPLLQRQAAWMHRLSKKQRISTPRPQASAQDFPAATVDYDADSDSMDDFSSGDDAPLDFSDFDADGLDLEAEAEAEPEEEENTEDGDDSLVASTSGEGPVIEMAGMPSWGKAALESAQSVLKQSELEGLQIYSFRAAAKRDKLFIRLDKVEDQYGSPSLDEVSIFSREFYSSLESKVGEQAAGKLSVEVSSPGAERMVRVPSELQRFQALPMLVTHETESEKGSRVLRLIEMDAEAGTSVWGLADVKVNRDKRQKLTKKQEAQRFEIPLSAIKQARLHLDA